MDLDVADETDKGDGASNADRRATGDISPGVHGGGSKDAGDETGEAGQGDGGKQRELLCGRALIGMAK